MQEEKFCVQVFDSISKCAHMKMPRNPLMGNRYLISIKATKGVLAARSTHCPFACLLVILTVLFVGLFITDPEFVI